MASYESISIISSVPKLPPGFRFHPSDEELIVHYLRPKATLHPVPESIITEIDLYKYNPWELPQLALFGEGEWYFFTPRDRKYPKGERPNRAAGLGFWKATGTDKPIFRSSGLSNPIGLKKGLVFCSGRPPKGKKTGWSMNEYRLFHSPITSPRLAGSMRLDDWVLCRIRHRGSMSKNSCEVRDKHGAEMPMPEPKPGQKLHIRSGRDMLTDYLNKDSLQIALLLLGGQPVPPTDTFPSVNLEGNRNGNSQNSFTLSGYGSCISEFPNSMDNCLSLKLGETSEQTNKGYLDRMKTTEDNLASQTVIENDIYGYIQNQPLYGANQIDSAFEFQAPNDLEVTGKYLQYCSSSTQRAG